jgi:hypothetical protein
MATKKKLLQAAAGSAGGGAAALNVEDVFATHLYEGNNDNSKSQGFNTGIALGSFGVGSSTYFDGTEYAIERSGSALTGSSGGSKEFTYSGWIQFKRDDISSWASVSFNGFYFMIYGNENQLIFIGRNSSNTNVFYGEINGINPRLFNNGQWFHILISADLTNTSNRYVYINDVAQSVTWNTYTNDFIRFDQTTVTVGNRSIGGYNLEHYQAHLYLDFTYRDLSVTSNRRLFIDANGGTTSTASLSALNPILYLPMTDGYSIGENLGTGGDFSDNGGASINTDFGVEYDTEADKGGLVWIKELDNADNHFLSDTERGATKTLRSNSNNAQSTDTGAIKQFTVNGFVVGDDASVNQDQVSYASWTFRKAPKFFDVVTYTGTGSTQNISHNLGAVPGVIIVKRTSSVEDWLVYHRSTGNQAGTGLNESAGTYTGVSAYWNSTTPTDSVFTVGTHSRVNTSGQTYVAYLFAHNDGDGEFGPDGDQDIIKCGSYTGNGSADGPTINLGFEPQFLIVRKSQGAGGNWFLIDNMRSDTAVESTQRYVLPDSNGAESSYTPLFISFHPTGFKLEYTGGNLNASGEDDIYIAIRRGPMAVPTAGKDVFQTLLYTGNATVGTTRYTDIKVDALLTQRTSSGVPYALDRVRGGTNYLATNSQSVEGTQTSALTTMGQDFLNMDDGPVVNGNGNDYCLSMWKRAPKYFDIVTYEGNSTSGRTVNHNLEVAPEMMWVKARNLADHWHVYHSGIGASNYQVLNDNIATASSVSIWNNTAPTADEFTLGNNNGVNGSGYRYVAYLFSTLDGVSKVGSFSGTGNALNIDCGFSNGARYVILKRTDVTGHGWLVYDSERGIVAGNDPYIRIDRSDTEVTGTDLIDPYSAGFSIPSGTYFTTSGATYLFYAVAQ